MAHEHLHISRLRHGLEGVPDDALPKLWDLCVQHQIDECHQPVDLHAIKRVARAVVHDPTQRRLAADRNRAVDPRPDHVARILWRTLQRILLRNERDVEHVAHPRPLAKVRRTGPPEQRPNPLHLVLLPLQISMREVQAGRSAHAAAVRDAVHDPLLYISLVRAARAVRGVLGRNRCIYCQACMVRLHVRPALLWVRLGSRRPQV